MICLERKHEKFYQSKCILVIFLNIISCQRQLSYHKIVLSFMAGALDMQCAQCLFCNDLTVMLLGKLEEATKRN